jgi:tetratricopeptide (TPR) repeat protein
MSRFTPLAAALGCAGLLASAVLAIGARDGEEARYFDPVVSANRACRPPIGSKTLLQYYQLAAAKTEVRPFAAEAGGGSQAASELDDPPLWDNLGKLSFRITTSSGLAQSYFDQGLRLAYAFNHAEARRSFHKAQRLDPGCAMCYWGEALVLGPNINAPMVSSAAAPALAAARSAQEQSKGVSDKERALIAALSERYSDDPRTERVALDTAYANAMSRVAARFPRDTEIAVLYAESLMDLSPWDYWEAAGSRPKGKTAEIIATLERVLKVNPNHPGAIHYYIHMVEASSSPKRAEPYARRLAAAMPGAGHLVHMPFHIFYRRGLYKEALQSNKAAVAADEAYIAKAAPAGIYPQAYYPHNVHSLMVSAQMAGDGKTAIAAAEKLSRIVSEEAARTIPWVQPIKAAPYLAHAQFSAPETVLALPDPGDGFPYVKAMWHYAKGVASAARGDTIAAQKEAEAIAGIEKSADFADLIAGGVPANEVLAIARHVVQARRSQAQGDLKEAIGAFERAVALEDALPYSEPPYWYFPVRQSLGAVLLLSGDLERAEQAFRVSLLRAPNNGWALYGLLQVYQKLGNMPAATQVEKLLDKAWAGDRGSLQLARL